MVDYFDPKSLTQSVRQAEAASTAIPGTVQSSPQGLTQEEYDARVGDNSAGQGSAYPQESSSSSKSSGDGDYDKYYDDYISRGYDPKRAAEKADKKANGSSDSGSSAADDARKAAEDAARKAEAAAEQTRGDIRTGFGGVRSSLEQMGVNLGGMKEGDISNVGVQQNTQLGLGESAYNRSLGRLGEQRTEIQGEKKQSLQGLADDVRNSFMAGNLYLGARGASNSSATGMYALAMQQAANKNRANISGQTSTALNEVRLRESEAESLYGDAKLEIDQWASGQENSIKNHYGQLANDIELAKQNATIQETQALNQLSMQVMQNYQQETQQLKNTVLNYELEMGAMQEQARLNNEAIAAQGNYNYGGVDAPTLDSSITSTGQSRGTASVDSAGYPVKKEEESLYAAAVGSKEEENGILSQTYSPTEDPANYAGRQSIPWYNNLNQTLDLNKFMR